VESAGIRSILYALLQPHLGNNEYVKRVWTMQKTILAKDFLACCCGSTRMDDIFFQKATNDTDYVIYFIHDTMTLKKSFPRSWKTVDTPRAIAHACYKLPRLPEATMSPMASRLCQDPRDQLFGMYGMLGKYGFNPPTPDYIEDLNGAHVKLCIELIRQTRSLSISTPDVGSMWPGKLLFLGSRYHATGDWAQGQFCSLSPRLQIGLMAGLLSIQSQFSNQPSTRYLASRRCDIKRYQINALSVLVCALWLPQVLSRGTE
jgi:hypothetical protein